MRRIIYRSLASPDLDRAEMFRLLYQARVANEAKGLTGVLLRADDHMLQLLEGETWKLVATFETIRRDPRHRHVEVIDERSIAQATYPACPMRYFDSLHIAEALKFLNEQTQGHVPRPIEDAVRGFFADAFADADGVSPLLFEAARPSSARPC
ncbi:MAG: BLUF domain-containing protein [Porphyrobacter sp. IPPAS B-1204]|nr:MAG: BLUF domain-containing protein [Porphyrobacter sp. IPPAS B-1204]